MRRVAGVATLVVSALTLGACGGSPKRSTAATTSTPAPAATDVTAVTAATSTVPVTIAPAASTAPAESGTVTVALSQPITAASTVHTPVACDAESGHFLAQASFPTGDAANDILSFSVNVAGYRGPRHYRAEVTVEILGPAGDSTKATVAQDVAVDTSSHGAFSIAAEADNNRPIAGSIGWTCS